MANRAKTSNPLLSEELASFLQAAGKQAGGKDPLAVLLGQRGGLKGGKARAEALSSERRSEIARGAALKRWKKDDV